MPIDLRTISPATLTRAYAAFIRAGIQYPGEVTAEQVEIMGLIAAQGAPSFPAQLEVLNALREHRAIVVKSLRDKIVLKNEQIKARIGYLIQFFDSLMKDESIRTRSMDSSPATAIRRTLESKSYAPGKRPTDDKLTLIGSITELHPANFQFLDCSRVSELASAGYLIFSRLNESFDPAQNDNDLFQLIVDAFPTVLELAVEKKGIDAERSVKFNKVDLYRVDIKGLMEIITAVFGL